MSQNLRQALQWCFQHYKRDTGSEFRSSDHTYEAAVKALRFQKVVLNCMALKGTAVLKQLLNGKARIGAVRAREE